MLCGHYGPCLAGVWWLICIEESELCCLIDWANSLPLRGVMGWLETLCLRTILLLTNRQSPALHVFSHNKRDAHRVSPWTHSYPCALMDRDRQSTELSVFSHYRDAQSFYSISPIMAIHPLQLKSICFYLMLKLFPDALFLTLNTNRSVRLLFLSPG